MSCYTGPKTQRPVRQVQKDTVQTRLTSCRPHSVEYKNYSLSNIIKIALDNRPFFEDTSRRDHRCGRKRAVKRAHPFAFHLRGTKYVITFFFSRQRSIIFLAWNKRDFLSTVLVVVSRTNRQQLGGSVVCYCLPILPGSCGSDSSLKTNEEEMEGGQKTRTSFLPSLPA